jgi:serine/threonine-protein kinase
MTMNPVDQGLVHTIGSPDHVHNSLIDGEWLREGDLLAHRYRLLERTGAGGMSVIWRARDESLERVVAVKVLDAALAADRTHRELVRKEARAAARLSHPDATAVYDYGETSTPDRRLVAYVVMQLVDGEPLAIRLASGPLPWREAVRVAVRVARVLAAAHARGIVHRDITPDNVMLTADGAKVLDFGIAARIGEPDDDATGWTFGTPPYVAPERLDGTPAMTPTDVYSLGALLFEMLTGRPPYPETTWAEIEAAIREEPPPAPTGVPGLPAAVARICQRCLASTPAARPTAAEVADVLDDALEASDPGPRGANRRRWTAAGVTATATAAAVSVAVFSGLLDAPGGHVLRESPVIAAPTTPEGGPTAGQPPSATTETSPSPNPVVPSLMPPPPRTAPSTAAPPVLQPSVPQPFTRAEAFAATHAVIDRGVEAGEVRLDAALDLHQILDNLAVQAQLDSTADMSGEVANLQRKVDDRRREGAISAAVAEELTAALTALSAALNS